MSVNQTLDRMQGENLEMVIRLALLALATTFLLLTLFISFLCLHFLPLAKQQRAIPAVHRNVGLLSGLPHLGIATDDQRHRNIKEGRILERLLHIFGFGLDIRWPAGCGVAVGIGTNVNAQESLFRAFGGGRSRPTSSRRVGFGRLLVTLSARFLLRRWNGARIQVVEQATTFIF